MAIRLYDLAAADGDCRFSQHCWRVRLALRHKGLDFETVPWRFTEKEAIAFAGTKKVPVMVDGDTVIHDSWTIMGYLEDTYPERPSLLAYAAFLWVRHGSGLEPLAADDPVAAWRERMDAATRGA